MTDNEANELLKELIEHYGDKLVDPEVYPKIFEYQAKMYKYYRENSKE
jgi:hypothetical protein